MSRRQRFLIGFCAGALALTLVQGALLADESQPDAALWAALADGGKVMLIRHAQSEEATPEVALTLDEDGDCSREQTLSAAGRAQAEALGNRLRQQGVEVETVLSSELCRARETATLAFGAFEPWTPLNHPRVLPEDEATWLIEDVRERIAAFSGEANLALVTHGETITTLSFEVIEPAEIVVLAPDEADGFAVLGTLTLD
ncbi:MAG: histidine phosphatase family protein [Lamprobacter sp.]|uniref:histidine phosphatase family protein n=1 Tax=Lamprobacter sp. TaxID=3100796 RepID=UPI002B25E6FB|nr:histidine phosphatase family protein [Lamprobacter sp.]MEA3641794.1 histidine phosphatase family protein [Lamprobacter sp.]